MIIQSIYTFFSKVYIHFGTSCIFLGFEYTYNLFIGFYKWEYKLPCHFRYLINVLCHFINHRLVNIIIFKENEWKCNVHREMGAQDTAIAHKE